MIGRTVGELRIGDAVTLSRVVTRSDIAGLLDAVGDRNPVHRDRAFAATTPFGEPIAPGVWTAGLISTAIGTRLPGPGTIYVSQNLEFLRPVRVGDTIIARVEVTEVIPERNRVRLATTCRNQQGDEVLTGAAWVLPPKAAVRCAERPAILGFLGRAAFQPLVMSARLMLLWSGSPGALTRD